MTISKTERIDAYERGCAALGQMATRLEVAPIDLVRAAPDYYSRIDAKFCPDVDFSGQSPVFYKPKDVLDMIDKDRNCFHNTLLSLLPQTGFSPPLFGEVQILDVACGEAISAQPLANFFRSFFALQLPFFSYFNSSLNNNRVSYTGVDHSKVAIKNAMLTNSNDERIKLVTSDALKFMQGVGDKKYDVILVRHPGPLKNDDDAKMWGNMIAGVYAALSKDGILMITNYNCFEYLFAQDVLRNEVHANIKLEGLNPNYFVFDRPDGQRFARDRFVIFADKKGQK